MTPAELDGLVTSDAPVAREPCHRFPPFRLLCGDRRSLRHAVQAELNRHSRAGQPGGLDPLVEWIRRGEDVRQEGRGEDSQMWLGRHPDNRVGFLGLVALIALQGCGSVTPTTDSSARAAKIVVGVNVGEDNHGGLPGFARSDMPLFPALPNAVWWDQVVRRLVFSGVYRLDQAGKPVEDLAAEPCKWTEDLLTVTCPLRDARFHDGAPLTAQDVAFTFELLGTADCLNDPGAGRCVGNLARADASDAHTVVFHLSKPDPTFITVALPDVMIESRARIMDSYDRFRASSLNAKPDVLLAEAVRIMDALTAEDPVCAPLMADAERAIRPLGLELWDRAELNLGPNDSFNACGYAESLARALNEAARSLSLEGMEAIHAAYRILDYHQELPVGSGPWKVLSVEAGARMDLEAFDGFHRGPPATAAMEVRLLRTKQDAVRAVRDRSVDWLVQPFASQDAWFLRDGLDGEETGLTFGLFETPTWFGMLYNLRDGALFADARLREAVELCIDKMETVAAATRGQYLSIESPILPSSWAYEKLLEAPRRNVGRARELIEEAGWNLAADGIYVKSGVRLSADVPTRRNRPDRLTFLALVGDQVKDCGMEISPLETDDMGDVFDWPQNEPGTRHHWDLTFNGQISSGGPDDPANDDSVFRSGDITSFEKPDGDNMVGLDNEEVDTLLDQAQKTYDLEERARTYRQYQAVLADQRPMLFAYAIQIAEARSDQLTSTEGPLSEASATWWWQLEKLVKNEPAS
jgi:ABC-type transport system substrate-binding protein